MTQLMTRLPLIPQIRPGTQSRRSWLIQASLPLIAAALAILLAPTPAQAQRPSVAQQSAIIRAQSRIHPVHGASGMVVTQHRIASEVGRRILQQGGNAVDAAVATGFALAVVLPRAGNLAGGGFMLVHLRKSGETVAIDYREKAPAAAHRNLFLNAQGEADSNLSRFSHRSAGVPGTVAGLHHAWKTYGSLPWKKILQPAIKLADKGFAISRDMHSSLARAHHMQRNPAARAIFYKADRSPKDAGTQLRQRDLAKTLRLISKEGPSAFYTGEIAAALVAEMERGDGIITADDLANYSVVERQPVRGTYRGYEVVAMPPPSSGGIHLIQMLNILEGYDLRTAGYGSAASLHLLAEAMKPAFADRSVHLGDSDFYRVPTQWLISKTYAEEVRDDIHTKKARPSSDIQAGTASDYESPQTTHFSVVDKEGNAVANTYTLNFSYGSGIAVPGTGMLLNNEMDDFSSKPGVPNAYGLLGSEANAIEAGKRPLSSMVPTLMFEDGQLRLVTGSPGGSRIITTVLQQIVNLVDFDLNVAESVYAPRIHHQWQPAVLSHEKGFSPDTLKLLEKWRHQLREVRPNCALQSITVAPDGALMGASDPRRPDGAALGY